MPPPSVSLMMMALPYEIPSCLFSLIFPVSFSEFDSIEAGDNLLISENFCTVVSASTLILI